MIRTYIALCLAICGTMVFIYLHQHNSYHDYAYPTLVDEQSLC